MGLGLISVEEAWERIGAQAAPLDTASCPLDQALGAVVAEPIASPIDGPPFDNSAMDGYALRAADTASASAAQPARLRIAGEVAAGGWREEPVAAGTAVKIMTGAPLPPGADAVLMLEDGRLRDGVVEVRAPVPPGRHVRRRGEDVRQGATLVEAGRRLNAQRLGLLASSGVASVTVYRRPRVSLVATGSELIAAGAPLRPGHIYDSNRVVLASLLQGLGCPVKDLGVAPDDPAPIAARIRAGLDADVLLISGGVSVGAHDHVKMVLREVGMEQVFWRVNMKPGKPLLCGRLGGQWVFGLPGNPISCVIGYLVFIEPLLRRLEGEASAGPRYQRARLAAPVAKPDDRRWFMTAQLAVGEDGMLEATPTSKQGSAMMEALAQATGFVVVPETTMALEAGDDVEVLAFHGG